MAADADVPASEEAVAVASERAHAGPTARYRTFRRGMRSNPVLDLTFRAAVLTVGAVVVAAGVAMLALPGPGWATIVLGLMLLASEFAWARRSLDWTKAKALAARDRALAPEVKRRNQLIAMAVAAVIATVVAVYWRSQGFPGPVGTWLMENLSR